MIKIENNRSVWFTSDLHFGHKNIIKYCNRPFDSVEHMDQMMIDNWNAVVDSGDKVFMLGDFCFGDLSQWENYYHQLNGNIILIKGNHDKIQDNQIKHLFSGIYDYLEIKVKDVDAQDNWQHIVLFHYAMKVWNRSHHGAYHLFGHSHGTLPDDPNALSFDCGVDCHEFKPISYKQVKEIMSKKTFAPIDHHGESR